MGSIDKIEVRRKGKIETRGLGAGSYPEPLSDKRKSYAVEFVATIEGWGTILAENPIQAETLVKENLKNLEIEDTYNLKIEEITKVDEIRC